MAHSRRALSALETDTAPRPLTKAGRARSGRAWLGGSRSVERTLLHSLLLYNLLRPSPFASTDCSWRPLLK